ncbi:MAG: hypothetical protein JWN34_5771 [Bryobacterales bacterium]|nr:hypothetical protein [Bryobacterales bacterium]
MRGTALNTHSAGRFFVERRPHSLRKLEEPLGVLDAAVASE